MTRRLSKDGWSAIGLFVLAITARVGYWAMEGTRLSPDSQGIIHTCEVLGTAPGTLLTSYRGLLFSGFTVPFCATWHVSGGSADVWIGVQILLSSLAVVLVFDTARRLWGSASGVVAGLGLAGLFETFSWSIYLLSDTTFVFAIALAMWALTVHRESQGSMSGLGALVSLGFVATVRPFGAPLALAWLLLDALPERYEDYRLSLLPRRIAVAVVILGAIGITLLVGSLSRPLLSEYVLRYYAEGIVVHDDPSFSYEYTVTPAGSLGGFLLANAPHLAALSGLRVLAFFVPVVPRFSALHNLVNLLTLVPLLIGTVVGVGRLIRRRSGVLAVLLPPVVVLVGIVAVTWVDFDWRYRAPLGPVFAVLTGYAVVSDPFIDRGYRRLQGMMWASEDDPHSRTDE